MHPSKGVQKNMLKAFNFNKYKPRHRSLDNLQKNCQKIFSESDTEHILLIVVLMVGLCLDN